MAKEVLLGLHDPGTLTTYQMFFDVFGFSVTGVDSLDGMLEKMGIQQNAEPDIPPANHYDAYIMDTNLGDLGGPSHEPALMIYNHVRQSVAERGVKFMSVTGSDESYSGAEKSGVPVMIKEFDTCEKLKDFLSE